MTDTSSSEEISTRCVVVRVPVEVVTQILKYDGVTRKELAAVAKTCRYLRAIATPLLFQNLSFAADTRASFTPLQSVVDSEGKGPLVRTVKITKVNEAPWPVLNARAFSGILVAALGVMSSLSTLSIPFALLTDKAFDAIYQSSSIERLLLSPIHSGDRRIDLDRRVTFASPRPTPLVIRKLESADGEVASVTPYFKCLEDFLGFLDFHGVKVNLVELAPFFLFDVQPPTVFLTAKPFANLVDLSVGCLPHGFDETTIWLTEVLAAQKALETFDFTVMEYMDGFELGRDTWAGWIDGEFWPGGRQLPQEWAGVMVRVLTLSFDRNEDEENDWFTRRIEIVLPDGTIVTPGQVNALLEEEPCANTLSISDSERNFSLGWSDWPATVEALARHDCLLCLSLEASVTPTATVSTTIACSPACYSSLFATLPALYAATELIGGPAALWTLSVNLNVARLKLLAKVPDLQDVYVSIKGKSHVLVDFEIDIKAQDRDASRQQPPPARNVTLLNVIPKRPVEEILLDCRCFVCDDDGAVECPMLALRRCGAKEVRAALAAGGFDLEAFDRRPPTDPSDAGSFETFLRSSS